MLMKYLQCLFPHLQELRVVLETKLGACQNAFLPVVTFTILLVLFLSFQSLTSPVISDTCHSAPALYIPSLHSSHSQSFSLSHFIYTSLFFQCFARSNAFLGQLPLESYVHCAYNWDILFFGPTLGLEL